MAVRELVSTSDRDHVLEYRLRDLDNDMVDDRERDVAPDVDSVRVSSVDLVLWAENVAVFVGPSIATNRSALLRRSATSKPHSAEVMSQCHFAPTG